MVVRGAEGGDRTVYFEVGVWFNQETEHIHMTIPGHGSFHTTVNNKKGSKRYHPNLYKKLKGVLAEAGRWPDGPTEESGT